MKELFNYPEDAKELRKVILLTRHIALQKALLNYLAENHDKEVPKLVFNLSKRKYTFGFRASLLVLCFDYDIKNYITSLFHLFINDTYNTALYAGDLIVKYSNKIKEIDLIKMNKKIKIRLKKEKSKDKKDLQRRLIIIINEELQNRHLKIDK